MFKTGEEIIITKEWILQHINQEEIFEVFIGVKPIFNSLICSPFREDKKPTCAFKWFNGKLYMRDFGLAKSYDCFNIAGETLGDAINNIAIKFNLRTGSSKVYKPISIPLIDTTSTILQVKRKEFSELDLLYWSKYNINLETLKRFNVFSICGLWINSKNVPIDKLAFAYYFGNGEYKILQPNSKYKWISNVTRETIQGFNQLPKTGKLLVVTKALKDVMTYYSLGYTAVALQTESSILSNDQYNTLQSRFDKLIVNLDFDYTGIISTNKMKRLYQLEYKFLTNGRFNTINYKAKDISDYMEKYKLSQTKMLLDDTCNRMY